MGQVEHGMYLVETVDDVATLQLPDESRLSYVSQTTLSVDETRDIINALKVRFPQITSPKKDDICYATQNRQDAVKLLSDECDIVIVVGSPNSSNSNRLREVAALRGVTAYMVDNATLLQQAWFDGKQRVGVTAGASAPEVLVQAVIEQIRLFGATSVSELNGVEESIVFALPPGLREKKDGTSA
jgi:4-hydroxy-3-methylbut-2-enyl diphosphate reductase